MLQNHSDTFHIRHHKIILGNLIFQVKHQCAHVVTRPCIFCYLLVLNVTITRSTMTMPPFDPNNDGVRGDTHLKDQVTYSTKSVVWLIQGPLETL